MAREWWIDTRIQSPDANSFDRYVALILCDGTVSVGLARWMPKEGYTSGDWEPVWENTNGNKRSDGVVLYWRRWPGLIETR